MGRESTMEMPPLEEAVARIREAERASAFVRENYERLRHEYPNKRIALHDFEVVATGNDSWELVDNVQAAGFDLADVWTFYIPAEPMRLLL
jgi:hypothetical protein